MADRAKPKKTVDVFAEYAGRDGGGVIGTWVTLGTNIAFGRPTNGVVENRELVRVTLVVLNLPNHLQRGDARSEKCTRTRVATPVPIRLAGRRKAAVVTSWSWQFRTVLARSLR